MIENIRKYTGLMVVVLVLLFVGLVFLDGGVSKAFNGKPVMEVGDQSISEKEFNRQRALMRLPQALLPNAIETPQNSLQLAKHYLGEIFIESEQFKNRASIVSLMAEYLQPDPDQPERFIANRINIQKGGIKFGVTPSNDEVENFVETVLFTDADGNFDLEAYDDFTKSRLGNIGGIPGFNNYIRDLLTAQNLSKVLGGGISTEKDTERELFDVQKQEISGSKITLESGVYEGRVKPTEEEIKGFYDENIQNYNSDELRKITYVSIEPDWDKALERSKEAKAKAEAEEAERLKKAEEAKKKAEEAARKANEGAKTADDSKSAEEAAETKAETNNPAETPTSEKDDGAEKSSEPETSSPPAADGSQGDPGDSGEPAPTPVPSDSTDPALESNGTQKDPAPGEVGKDLNEPLKDGLSDEKDASPLTPTPAPLKPVTEESSAEPKTAKEQLNGAEKQEAVEALSNSINEFYQKLADNEGEDFEAIAKDSGYEFKRSEFFSKIDPPKELSAVIDSLQIGKISDAAFELPENGDSDEKLSEPFRTADGWFLIRLDEVEDSLPLTYEEAKVQVTVDLKKKMAREQMVKEANELFDKLTKEIKAGKSFTDAAKGLEKEVTEVTGLAEGQTFNFGQRSQRLPDPPEFIATQYTNPGEISPVYFSPSKEEATQAQIIFVEKRELAKKDEFETDFGKSYESRSNAIRFIALSNWLYDRYNESGVVSPQRETQQ